MERFWDELRARTHAPRVAEDVDSADASHVTGTPSFFVNGRRHDGAYDIMTLSRLLREAHATPPGAVERRSCCSGRLQSPTGPLSLCSFHKHILLVPGVGSTL